MSTETRATTKTKRVRLSLLQATCTVIPNAAPRVTATEAAVAHLRLIAESLSRHAFQDIIVELGNEIILATNKVHRQQAITASFDDDTRIPKSARVAFKLNASETVAGTAKFLAATEATNAAIAMFQTTIAAQVKVVAGLELTAAKLIYRSICIWAKIFAVLSRRTDETFPILQFTRVAASQYDMKPLLVDLDDETRDTIELKFLGAIAASAKVDNTPLAANQMSAELLEFTKTVGQTVAETIEAFEKAQQDNRAREMARALASCARTQSATIAAASNIDNDLSASPATLQSLVASEVARAIKAANKATNATTKSKKKHRGGGAHNGASSINPMPQSKKSSNRNRSKSSLSNRNNKCKRKAADGAANSTAASSSGNNVNLPPRQHKKSRSSKQQN
jgi:hypothetical protein